MSVFTIKVPSPNDDICSFCLGFVEALEGAAACISLAFVVIEGVGYGTGATVLLATADGRGTSYHRYVPAAERSLARWNNDQLATVRAIAGKVAAHAQDFLSGVLTEYETLARPLPPYRTLRS